MRLSLGYVIASGDGYPSLYSGQAIAALTTKHSPHQGREIARMADIRAMTNEEGE